MKSVICKQTVEYLVRDTDPSRKTQSRTKTTTVCQIVSVRESLVIICMMHGRLGRCSNERV